MRGRSRAWLIAAVGIGLVAIVAAIAIPGVRWRLQLIALGASGGVPDVEFSELLRFMMPTSGQSKMVRLLKNPNPYAAIYNPLESEADRRAGEVLYNRYCADCHALDGVGSRGAPALVGREFTYGESDWAFYRTVRLGVPKTAMPAHPFDDTQLWQVIGYVRALQSKVTRTVQAAGPASLPNVNLDAAKLVSTQLPGDEWLTYAGSYSGQRHSTLDQVKPDNVDRLAVQWVHQFSDGPIPLQSAPIVHAGRMFVTAPPQVLALDLRTGRTLWKRDVEVDRIGPNEKRAPAPNRGPALLGDRLFVGTRDARLLALSATTGEVLWETAVGDRDRHPMTGAPLVVRDMVVVGSAVAPGAGGRGFIAAYDAATGKQRWRFQTIPEPGQPGADTWSGESWRNGGGPTWITGSYDAAQDLLIWGVGNPKPDYDASLRRGDNLYTNSVVALRASTGELVWHFQFTPGDVRDWDSAQTPVLVDYAAASGIERRVLWANRNGFYYVLDRTNGKFVSGRSFVFQNWAEGLDANGRPVLKQPAVGNGGGSLVYPGGTGGTNWWSPTYDAALDTFFVPVLEQGAILVPASKIVPADAPRSFYTGVRALNGKTGAMLWEYRHEPRVTDNLTAGLLSTRSGVIFGSDLSKFFALDSRTGRRLFTFETGARIAAAPISYDLDGRQHVSVISGRTLLTFALPREQRSKSGKDPEKDAVTR